MYKVLLVILFGLPMLVSGQSVDPTKPFNHHYQDVAASKQKSTYVLQSIIGGGVQKTVVINGQLLSLGDRIGPYQLSTITQKYVVLTSPDNELKMSLFSSVVAK